MTIQETHEPDEPINWPDGHVSVVREPRSADSRERIKLADIDVKLTDLEDDECILVSLAGCRHYLHSTTARALSDKLIIHDGHAVAITIHDVKHSVGRNASRALRQTLQRRLTEWNTTHAGSMGWSGV